MKARIEVTNEHLHRQSARYAPAEVDAGRGEGKGYGGNSMMRNLRGMGNQIRVSLPTDKNGMIDRKCPNSNCEGIFKVKTGTGLKGSNLPCHCPYCGHKTDMGEFNTSEQIEYAKSVAINQIKNAIERDIQALQQLISHHHGKPLHRHGQKQKLIPVPRLCQVLHMFFLHSRP